MQMLADASTPTASQMQMQSNTWHPASQCAQDATSLTAHGIYLIDFMTSVFWGLELQEISLEFQCPASSPMKPSHDDQHETAGRTETRSDGVEGREGWTGGYLVVVPYTQVAS